MRNHAWCRDIPRDEAVRAAEDNRPGPLPTLEEAIQQAFGFDEASVQRACDETKTWPADVQADAKQALSDLLEQGVPRRQALAEASRWGKRLLEARYPAMIPKTGSASSGREHKNKGDDMGTNGLRTERVTLEVVYDSNTQGHPEAWDWSTMVLDPGESVRVVEDETERLLIRVSGLQAAVESARHERDAAIRERDVFRRSFHLSEEAGTRLVAERDASLDDAAGLRARVAELEGALESVADRAAAAETALESAPAASANGGLNPHAWGVVLELHDAARAFRDSSIHVHQVRLDKALAAAERLLTQPRPATPAASDAAGTGWLTGDERLAVSGAILILDQHGQTNIGRALNYLLARSTPPEVVLPGTQVRYHRLSVEEQRDDQWIAALAAAGVPVKEVGRWEAIG